MTTEGATSSLSANYSQLQHTTEQANTPLLEEWVETETLLLRLFGPEEVKEVADFEEEEESSSRVSARLSANDFNLSTNYGMESVVKLSLQTTISSYFFGAEEQGGAEGCHGDEALGDLFEEVGQINKGDGSDSMSKIISADQSNLSKNQYYSDENPQQQHRQRCLLEQQIYGHRKQQQERIFPYVKNGYHGGISLSNKRQKFPSSTNSHIPGWRMDHNIQMNAYNGKYQNMNNNFAYGSGTTSGVPQQQWQKQGNTMYSYPQQQFQNHRQQSQLTNIQATSSKYQHSHFLKSEQLLQHHNPHIIVNNSYASGHNQNQNGINQAALSFVNGSMNLSINGTETSSVSGLNHNDITQQNSSDLSPTSPQPNSITENSHSVYARSNQNPPNQHLNKRSISLGWAMQNGAVFNDVTLLPPMVARDRIYLSKKAYSCYYRNSTTNK